MSDPYATVEICFNNNSNSSLAFDRAWIWHLKKLLSDPSAFIINEMDNCWDIIAYNRFFYDVFDSEKEIVDDEIFFW